MDTLTSGQARARLNGLLDETATSRRPVLITGKRHNAVLVSEEDWHAIQETLYLLSVPGMRQSIVDGMKTPATQCAKRLDW